MVKKVTAKEWVGENANTLHERRISINSAGQVQGAVDWNANKQAAQSNVDGSNLLQDYYQMLQVNKNTTTPSIIRGQVDSLKKKVDEYKKMLSVVEDATVKAFLGLMLQTVQEELVKINGELAKLPNQYGFVDPYTPQYPSPTYPGLNPGVTGPFVGQVQERFDSPYSTTLSTTPFTVCAGKTCTTFDMQTPLSTSLVETLYNNNEENS